MISIGDSRWRMLRRVELHPTPPARWNDIRTFARRDETQMAILIRLGLVHVTDTRGYLITEAGQEVARFGEIDSKALMTAEAAEKKAQQTRRSKIGRATARLKKKV